MSKKLLTRAKAILEKEQGKRDFRMFGVKLLSKSSFSLSLSILLLFSLSVFLSLVFKETTINNDAFGKIFKKEKLEYSNFHAFGSVPPIGNELSLQGEKISTDAIPIALSRCMQAYADSFKIKGEEVKDANLNCYCL